MQIDPPRTVVYITWKELFDEKPTESSVLEFVRTLSKESTVAFLARIMGLLFLDRALAKSEETIKLQSLLINNLFDDEIFDRAKRRLGAERLDFRIAFHPQQILLMMKWVLLHGLSSGGMQPDTDEWRHSIGRALLKTSDFLITNHMAIQIANPHSNRDMLRLQLSVGSGNEVANPPSIVNGVARTIEMFGKLLKTVKLPIDLNRAFETRAGLSIGDYIDLTLALLANYLGRTPKELVENPNIPIVDPRTFFGTRPAPDLIQNFWRIETTVIDDLIARLSSTTTLLQHQDFTAFRVRPFLQLSSGNVVCIYPGFIQEKLESGLFWTIANSLEGIDRQNSFDAWGKLFESYVNETFAESVDPNIERYIPQPEYSEKRNRHESFDGMLVSQNICVVFECKGGFLPNNAKYGDDVGRFIASLDRKYGTQERAGVEQLSRKIGYVFGRNEKLRRSVEGLDSTKVKIIIPVLVVQDEFVSSPLTVPWLAKEFRDLMRKIDLSRHVLWPSLVVLHVEDVEKLGTYAKAKAVSVSECLLIAAKMGDPRPGNIFSFDQVLRSYLKQKGISKIPPGELTRKLREAMNSVTMRLFDRPFGETQN
jgi:hypothetical protein